MPPDPVTGRRRRQDFGAKREAQAALAEWQVDQRKGTLVDRSSQTVADMMAYKPVLGPPKTRKARRDIPVDDALLETLRAHRGRQAERRLALGPLWQDHDLVFAADGGMPIRPRNLPRDYEKLIKLARVRRIRIHDGRHTWVTWALEEGAAMGAVSKMAGHASSTITMNLYAHVIPRMEREAVRSRALEPNMGRVRRPFSLICLW